MLASITPLGERGRHNRWVITATAFLIGSTGGGAALGALLGAVGGLIGAGRTPADGLVVLAVGLAGAAALDLRLERVPGPRRQVDERWLDEYRGWVYGLGYGAQLGVGLATVVSSAATYVALLAALLAAHPGEGAAIVGAYGAVRGLTPVLSARIRAPAQLLALHSRLQRIHGMVLGGSALVLIAAAVAAGVVGAGP